MSAEVMPETSENSAAVHGTPLTSQLFPTDAMALKDKEKRKKKRRSGWKMKLVKPLLVQCARGDERQEKKGEEYPLTSPL
jgi:hypothetical protein